MYSRHKTGRAFTTDKHRLHRSFSAPKHQQLHNGQTCLQLMHEGSDWRDFGKQLLYVLVLGWVYLQLGKPPQYETRRPGQLSLVSFVELEMSTSQSAGMLCGWE